MQQESDFQFEPPFGRPSRSFQTPNKSVKEQSYNSSDFDSGKAVTDDHLNTLSSPAGANGKTRKRDLLQHEFEELIEEINAKRNRDSELLEKLKQTMELTVNRIINSLQESFFAEYEETTLIVNAKMAELMAKFNTIDSLEEELVSFRHGLGLLVKDADEIKP